MTKQQANNINKTFDSQSNKIRNLEAQLSAQTKTIDSLLKVEAALKQEYDNTIEFLTYMENWILARAQEGSWLYYSYDSLWIEAVDLSVYKVRKDDATGDLFFIRAEDCPDLPPARDNKDYPKRGWEKQVVLPNRPKINKL